MTTRVEIYKPYLGVGKVYLRNAASSSSPRYEIGNVSELKLAIDEGVIKQKNYTTAGGGVYAEVRRIESVVTSMKLHDLNADNLALAQHGTNAHVTSGSVSDEAVVAYPGALIRLKHPSPASVTLKSSNGEIIYTDYEVRPEGLFIKASGDIASAAAGVGSLALKVNYTHAAYEQIEALTQAGQIWEISFAGINEADSGKPVLVDLYRVSLGAAKELSLISDALGTIDLEGELLIDTSKGAGKSAYYQVQQV